MCHKKIKYVIQHRLISNQCSVNLRCPFGNSTLPSLNRPQLSISAALRRICDFVFRCILYILYAEKSIARCGVSIYPLVNIINHCERHPIAHIDKTDTNRWRQSIKLHMLNGITACDEKFTSDLQIWSSFKGYVAICIFLLKIDIISM